MQSLLKAFTECYTVDYTFKELEQYIDLTKLSDETLKKICDNRKMTRQDIFDAFSDKLSDNDVFNIFKKYNPSLEGLQAIEIDKFSEIMKRKILGYMLIKNIETNQICVLLDKIKSVNYGDSCMYEYYNKYEDNNPLFHCCFTNKIDLVKLLVEKYNANIDYTHNIYAKTAITLAAERKNEDIIYYLYSKGAKYPKSDGQTTYLEKLINGWEIEKSLPTQQQLVQNKKQIENDQSKLLVLLNFLNSHSDKYSDQSLKGILNGLCTEILYKKDSLEFMKSIEFEKFSHHIQRYFLNIMIQHKIPAVIICVLLNKMKSVNYGNDCYGVNTLSNAENINPLIYCCQAGRMDLVKLLVENYGANIDYLIHNDRTAISFSADGTYNFKDITEYLYKKGARVPITCKGMCQRGDSWDLINKLESDKANKQDVLKEKYEKLKSDFDNLKSLFDVMNNNRN